VDLTGRAQGYRGAAVRCPGCAEAMTVEILAEAEVDVCGACGGMWVDWFDGEVKRVATEVLKGETERQSRPGLPTSNLRNEAFATGACPRCTRQLAIERYVVKANVRGSGTERTERTSVSTTTGADLLRCEECAGVFVPRTSAGLLATLPADEDEAQPPSASTGPGVLEPLPWQRFMAVVRRLIGLGTSE
jgi:Zn-finger nucleic acid-binding protein